MSARRKFAHVEITAEQGHQHHQPTPAQRQLVTVLRSVSVPDYTIAKQLGIAKSTLYKHYKDELDHGMELVVSNVAASVVKKALKGDNQMIRFYLQTHAAAESLGP
jgi:hypothetical protein